MSQYSPFLATTPTTPVLKTVSSPESTRQFGNPRRLAQPWVIFRRPSEMRYTATPGRADIDCVLTTTSEEIIPVKISTTPHEHTDICADTTSVEITLPEQSASSEMTYEAPELSRKDIYCLCDVTSVEIAPLKPSIKPEVSSQDIGIRSDLTPTDIINLRLSMKSDLILKVSGHSSQSIDCISDDITPVENDLLKPAETTKSSSKLSGCNTDCVSNINSPEITPLRFSKTAECAPAPPKFSSQDFDCISDVTSAETALLGPSTNQESIFGTSKLLNEIINCVSSVTSVETTKRFPEHTILSNQDIESRPMEIPPPTLATKLQLAQAASILPYQEIEPHHDTSFLEINPFSNSKTLVNQNAGFDSDPTPVGIAPRIPSISLEAIRGGLNISNQESDDISGTIFLEITPVESSANPEPVLSASKISSHTIDHLPNYASDITSVKLSQDSRLTPSFLNSSSQDIESSSSTNYPNHSRRRYPLPRKPVSVSSSLSTPAIRLAPVNSGESKKGHAAINSKRPSIRFSGSALHPPTEEQVDARKRHASATGRLERAPNVRMPTSSKFRGVSVVPNKALAARPRARSTDQILSTMPEIGEKETENSKVPSTTTTAMRTITNRPPLRGPAPQKLSGSFRFSGSDLHLPSAEEEEKRRSHALTTGRLARAPSVRRSVQPVPKLPDIRMSRYLASSGFKGAPGSVNRAQRAKATSCTLAVMSEVEEVEEEEVAAQAECNSIPKAEERVEETVVAASIAAGPRELPNNARRRKAIVWQKLDSISEEEGEEEPAATAQKDLEEAPVVQGEGQQGGDLVFGTPSPEVRGEESVGIEPAGTPPPRHTRYQTPSRWSSRIGEMRAARKPSYGWETASIPDISRAEPMLACYPGSPACERERVRYPAPMRWSSRIGEVRAARTLGYAGTGIPFPLPPQADKPEEQDLGAPEGEAGADFLFGNLPLFPDLILEAILAPQRAESPSNSGKSSGSQGTGTTMGSSIKHRVRVVWKKVEGWGRIRGRVFSGRG